MNWLVVPEESERWTTVIAVGELQARVELRDRRVVPGGDLAQVDFGDRPAVEFQARLDARKVVGDGDAPKRSGRGPAYRSFRRP